MYHSPLREDRTPSFSVSTKKNLWNDLGAGIGGNVIDLALQLNGNCTFHKAVTWLEEQYRLFSNSNDMEHPIKKHHVYINPQRPSASDIRDIRIVAPAALDPSIWSPLAMACRCREPHPWR